MGEGSDKISSMDADEVALLSIQALKKQNENLQVEVSELRLMVQSLIEQNSKE